MFTTIVTTKSCLDAFVQDNPCSSGPHTLPQPQIKIMLHATGVHVDGPCGTILERLSPDLFV